MLWQSRLQQGREPETRFYDRVVVWRANRESPKAIKLRKLLVSLDEIRDTVFDRIEATWVDSLLSGKQNLPNKKDGVRAAIFLQTT